VPETRETQRPPTRLAWRDAVVFLGFTALSFGYFGAPLLPHPGRVLLGDGIDNTIFVWSFAWWPHAILSGMNPFVTHALYAQDGVNLLWTSSVPTLALAFAPVTLLAGPIASFNLAALLLPALAAWTAYWLCFVLTRSVWASLVGGYLFGFSSFVLAHQQLAHLNLTGCFLLPLIALAIVRYVRGEWSRRRLAIVFGALMALQLGISTEVALTATLMIVLGLVLAFAIVPSVRPRLRGLAPGLAAGYALGAVFAAPFTVYALIGFPSTGFVQDPVGTDLLNVIVPTPVNGLVGDESLSHRPYFNLHESAIFLGLPVLAIVALYAWRWRHSRWTWFLVSGLLLSIVLALGPRLRVAGHDLGPLPWKLLEKLRVFEDVRTPRFGEYVALASALIVALWTARMRGQVFRRPFVLPALAVMALIPAFWRPLATLHPNRPAFFASGLYTSCLGPNETLAVYGTDANLLQIQTGFRFRIAGGYLSPITSGAPSVVAFNRDPTVHLTYFFGDRGIPSADAFLAFAARHRVDRFIAVPGTAFPTAAEMKAFGPVQRIAGVAVAPACGSPPLTSRPLPASAQRMLADQSRDVSVGYCRGASFSTLPVGLEPGGVFEGWTRAVFVAGKGLECIPPRGYVDRGWAGTSLGVPADTYRLYAPR
jgi:hypothetical protein